MQPDSQKNTTKSAYKPITSGAALLEAARKKNAAKAEAAKSLMPNLDDVGELDLLHDEQFDMLREFEARGDDAMM